MTAIIQDLMLASKLAMSFLPRAAASPNGARATPDMMLTRATARASLRLGLTVDALAGSIGVSEETASRILQGEQSLAPASKEADLAGLLVRVCHSVDALVDNDDGKRAAWMSSWNQSMGCVPQEMVQTSAGLIATMNHLKTIRATA